MIMSDSKALYIGHVLLNGEYVNVRMEHGVFTGVGKDVKPEPGDEIFHSDLMKNMAIVPPFYNMHTHAAMTLLRGYADDMELFTWLNEHIWPFEAKMTADDIRIGSELAVLEMIKSGTVFFNDMYWNTEETWKALDRMGIRGCMGVTLIDSIGEERIEASFDVFEKYVGRSSRILMSLAPHAVYTVGEKLWLRAVEAVRKHHAFCHFHLSETKKEVHDCVKEHGLSPVRWLDKLGVLGPDCIAAHVVHVDAEELAIMKERGVTIAHNPISNMKLSSGFFRTKMVIDSGCRVTIGTDGCSSNNNLDMREEVKCASMIAKCNYGPEILPVDMAVDWATKNGAEAFGINGGEIKVGKVADALLIDLDNERFVPCYNFNSNLVNASSNEAFNTLICDGKIVMKDRKVKDEERIIAEARECCKKWMK